LTAEYTPRLNIPIVPTVAVTGTATAVVLIETIAYPDLIANNPSIVEVPVALKVFRKIFRSFKHLVTHKIVK
jgi:hypothetical protein